MGRIIYDGSECPIEIDDRTLAHLKVVIATKLRRNEAFTFSWVHPDSDKAGRSTIWIHPSIPLRFEFEDPEPPTLNRHWIEKLMHSANQTGGIALMEEDPLQEAG